ncbi:hypothetical protein C8R47DRAFT_812488 [Mycena vitilis]|nr:hypothetical protein C8R47DRAFT_812488 [Mycena vitilis]
MLELNNFYAPWFHATFLGSLLFGCILVNTLTLITGWRAVSRLEKAATTILLCAVSLVIDCSSDLLRSALHTIQSGFAITSARLRFSSSLGTFPNVVSWLDSVTLISGYLATTVIQMWSISLVWKLTGVGLSPRTRVETGGIVLTSLLALLNLAAGIAHTCLAHHAPLVKLGETQILCALQASASLACDVFAGGGLCYVLRKSERKVFGRNIKSLAHKFILQAIERGVLPAFSSCAALVLVLTVPGSVWFVLALGPNSQFHTLGYLATISTRQQARRDREDAAMSSETNSVRFGDEAKTRSNQHERETVLD